MFECGVRGQEREWGCVAIAWVVAGASAMFLQHRANGKLARMQWGGGCRGQVDGLCGSWLWHQGEAGCGVVGNVRLRAAGA